MIDIDVSNIANEDHTATHSAASKSVTLQMSVIRHTSDINIYYLLHSIQARTNLFSKSFLPVRHSRRQLEEVHKECKYEAERAEKLRRKVTNRLMGGILAPEIPLYGFNMTEAQRRTPNTRMVKSLRTQVRERNTLGRLSDTLGGCSLALATLVILNTLVSLTSSSATPSSPHPYSLPICHFTLHHYLPTPSSPHPPPLPPHPLHPFTSGSGPCC